MKIESLIAELECISKKNRDKFRYRIDVNTQRERLAFAFVAEETADGHTFLTGYGHTIEEAVIAASSNVPHAVEAWGYE